MTSVWRSSVASSFRRCDPGNGTVAGESEASGNECTDGIRLCDGARGKKIDEIAIQPFSWKSVYSYSADWTKSIGNTIVPTTRKRSPLPTLGNARRLRGWCTSLIYLSPVWILSGFLFPRVSLLFHIIFQRLLIACVDNYCSLFSNKSLSRKHREIGSRRVKINSILFNNCVREIFRSFAYEK